MDFCWVKDAKGRKIGFPSDKITAEIMQGQPPEVRQQIRRFLRRRERQKKDRWKVERLRQMEEEDRAFRRRLFEEN